MHCLAAVRILLNGVSLLCQFLFPGRGRTANYGDEQLFYRGCIRAVGVPLYLFRGFQKMYVLSDPEWVWERTQVEIAADFIRALVFIPIQSWSLFHQWRYTGRDAETVPVREACCDS